MIPPDESGGNSPGRRSKVARLIDEYDLIDLGAELEERWTADDESRESLRELATRFNQELLAHKTADAGMQLLDGGVENLYRLLSSDDVSQADRTRAERRLERAGVDVARLRKEFVTYQAIRTYLKTHRDAEYVTEDVDPVQREIDNLQQLRGRTATVITSKLEQLRDAGDLRLGSFQTLVDLRVVCDDCGSQYALFDLLEERGCDCDQPQ